MFGLIVAALDLRLWWVLRCVVGGCFDLCVS